MNKYSIISVLLLIIGQSLAWMQQFSQIKWPWFRDNLWFCAIIMAIPASYAFIYGAKFGYIGFGDAWAVRLFQFSIGMVIMAAFNFLLLGEGINLKNGLSIILAILIIVIQIYVK